MSLRRLPAILVLCLTGPALSAQTPSRSRGVEATFFVDFLDRRDPTISQLRYAGRVTGARAGYVSRGSRYQKELGVELRAGNLEPSRGAGAEALSSGGVSFALLRAASRSALVGLAFHGDANSVDHRYGSGLTEEFFTSTLTLSPIADWTPTRWGGHIHARAWCPLLAYVAHPYSRVKVFEGSLYTLVGPSRWRALSLELTRISNDTRRVAMVAAYRLDLRSYREEQGLASVESRLLASVRVRLGRIAP